MLRCLVTGGAGFIGSHLVRHLLRDGWKVTVADDLSAGWLVNVPKSESVVFRLMDLRDQRAVDGVMKNQDAVFHFAAQANIRQSLVDHRSDLDTNVGSMMNILEAMVRNSVHDLVFASTSALYGEATVVPTPENYMPVQTSLYGASKLASEALAQSFVQFAPISLWSFRFSNVIGPFCRRGVIWDFVHKLMADRQSLEILGDGKQSKEYLYVSDCVEGVLAGYHRAKDRVNTFNLAVEENLTADEVAAIVMREMGLDRLELKHTGGKRGWIGDNPVVHLSIEKMKALGWKPKVSPSDAVALTARWTREHLEGPKLERTWPEP